MIPAMILARYHAPFYPLLQHLIYLYPPKARCNTEVSSIVKSLNIILMQKRNTFIERFAERLSEVEKVIQKLGSVDSILDRMSQIEEQLYTTKAVFSFKEACTYIGVSDSMLYKLTARNEIPHYKPRGKMIYFSKKDLDEWLQQNHEPTGGLAIRINSQVTAAKETNNSKENGRRKKK